MVNAGRFRHEYKYVIDMKQESILRIKAMGIMPLDSHVGDNGTYLIRSLYFDDINDTSLKENIAGIDPRSKFRIRYYNSDTDHISLEKKSKVRGMCLKESCHITEEECRTFIEGGIPQISVEMSDMKKKLFAQVWTLGLLPKVIVTYERVPFVYGAGNVRITFDGKITSSFELERFMEADYLVRPVLGAGKSILEVKWDDVIPRHIKDTLRLERLEWTAFSKYSMCRMFHN